MNLKNFKDCSDWIKIWSGRWSLYFDYRQGEWWTKKKDIMMKPTFRKVIYFYKNGVTDCWVSARDKDDLGKQLSSAARRNVRYVAEICRTLKKHAEQVAAFIDNHNVKNIGLKEFNEFWDLLHDYFVPHICVKYIADYLSVKELKFFLPKLEEARLFSEFLPRKAENYFYHLAGRVATEVSYTREMILTATKEELQSYFQGKKLPSRAKLKNRYHGSALILDKKSYQIFTGNEVRRIEKNIFSQVATNEIRGQIAYQGKARGHVKIVFNPSRASASFIKGDILVTGMTRPEFLPLMKKSGGFITDAGGILSHAAIVAREIKKPCIIGTKIATKILKDNDLVEVDADKGIVKIIK